MSKQKRKLIGVSVAVAAAVVFVSGQNAYAMDDRSPDVKIYDPQSLDMETSFLAFASGFKGGGSVATADLDCNGEDEIIVGAGPGGGPHVRIFEGDGTPVRSFFAFPMDFHGGVRVAAGDLNGDCRAEIVVAPGPGGGPQVRYLDAHGNGTLTPGFYAYAENYRGGINLAVADIDGDGKSEVVTATGMGATPHVRIFNRFGVHTGPDFYPFAERDRGGVSVAAANVDGGPEDELIFGINRFGRAQIKVYTVNDAQTILGLFEGWPEAFQGGVNVAGGDLDGDGLGEVLAGVASAGDPHVRGFEGYGAPLSVNFFPYEAGFRGGVNVAIGDVDGDGTDEIVTIPGRNTITGRTDLQQYIDVNLTEQRLYAYENGYLARTFQISSGIARYPSPQGEFSVLAKIPVKDYEWSYGPNHPDNYDIKDVKDNLRFANGYYLHSATWHHNFGHPMSHGCINISPDNATWLYIWANVGIPVLIHT